MKSLLLCPRCGSEEIVGDVKLRSTRTFIQEADGGWITAHTSLDWASNTIRLLCATCKHHWTQANRIELFKT